MYVLTAFLLGLLSAGAAAAPHFVCAGTDASFDDPRRAAKAAQISRTGTRHALVLFARFADETPDQTRAPAWADGLFDPGRPGSFTHFYDAMSFGALHITGAVAPRRYASAREADFYLADDPTAPGFYSQFALEILRQADRDIDFARFDNDGPDGVPDSGDDDGFVDAVFIVASSTPPNFLLGNATGIFNFNLVDERIQDRDRLDRQVYITGDPGAGGAPIRIASGHGSILRGRTYAEAAGSMAHEYGHVLGLPDLFNTGFLQRDPDAGPAGDSAGIGAWGLMGWGALGWNRDDGPNSFSAWSRMRLGWSPLVEVSRQSQRVEMAAVGGGGPVVLVPLTERESFLLEYRRRDNYYDRHIPAEGVLVWHVDANLQDGVFQHRTVDLEAADGRWADKGFPLGAVADTAGGDNLDFWAHDAAYAAAHGGNLGDATDPFDGARFRAFTPRTNPAATSNRGGGSVRIEDIQILDGAAAATVHTAPPRLAVENLRYIDGNEDGVLAVGEEGALHFGLVNRGGLRATAVRSVLRSDDELLELRGGESLFSDLAVGKSTPPGDLDDRLPRIRWRGDFVGARRARLTFDLYAGDQLVGQHHFDVVGAAPAQDIAAVAVIDSLGNGDGAAQAGEFIRLGLTLGAQHPAALRALRFSLRALDDGVERIGSASVSFAAAAGGGRSTHSPEFLLPADLAPGATLAFELEAAIGAASWRDTVRLPAAAGGDRTPPRLTLLRARADAEGLGITLSPRWILDASAIRAARAQVFDATDTTLLASVPLPLTQGQFAGTWPDAQAGAYLVRAEAEDAAGNLGFSAFARAVVVPGDQVRLSAQRADSPWRQLDLPHQQRPAPIFDLAFAPSHANVLYATTGAGLWRSDDAGATWQRTSMMLNGIRPVYNSIYVDPQDPLVVYATETGRAVKSTDGGLTWSVLRVPDPGAAILGFDQAQSGRLYAYSFRERTLFVSEDEGRTWRASPLRDWPSFFATHPTAPATLYAGSLSSRADSNKPGELHYSTDGGGTWQRQPLDRIFRSLAPDPADPAGLYGIASNALWRSADHGRTWTPVALDAGEALHSVYAIDPDVLYAWGNRSLWHSTDRGATWQRARFDHEVSGLAAHPRDPGRVAVSLAKSFRETEILHSRNFGRDAEPVVLLAADLPAGTMAFAPSGQPYVATRGPDPQGRLQAGVYTSLDGQQTWEWRGDSGLIRQPDFFDLLHIDPLRPDILIAHANLPLGTYLRSVNGGRTWERAPTGARGSFFGTTRNYPEIAAVPGAAGTYYFEDRYLFYSEDFGERWTEIDLSTPEQFFASVWSMALDPAASGSLYVIVDQTLRRSDDGGQSWADLGPVAPGVFVIGLDFYPGAPSRLYAIATSGLYASADRGLSWTQILAPAVGRWSSGRLRFHPTRPDAMYLVTSRYLYESGDRGATWREIGREFGGNPWFNDLVFDPFDAHRLYLATSWGVYTAVRDGDIPSAVAAPPARPRSFALEQNFPNPFNAATTIDYHLPRAGRVRLTVYNILGQPVRELVNGRRAAGAQRVAWDGRDDRGRPRSSGLYFYRLATPAGTLTRQMVLLK